MRCGVPIVPNGEPCDREKGHQGPHIRATVVGETPTGEQVRFVPAARCGVPLGDHDGVVTICGREAGHGGRHAFAEPPRCALTQVRVAAINEAGVASNYRCVLPEGHADEHVFAYDGQAHRPEPFVPPDMAREQREAEEGVRPERERSARESLRMIAAELDQADGETHADVHERVRRITGAALAHYASDFEPWQPGSQLVGALADVVATHGGVLLVTRYDVHYLASDEGRRIKALPFADGTVSVEVDDG